MHRRGPGSFCWFDLKTYDVAATGAALSTDLGWSVSEPERLRAAAILSSSGYPVASLSDLSNPVYPDGTPEHIAWYLAIDDLDVRTRAALAAGAELVVEPFELPGVGAMSTIIDPLGAAVSLLEQHGFFGWTHPPTTPRTPSAPQHRGPDPAAARDFYTALGLDDPTADFVRDSSATCWTARITALPRGSLRTPGGTSLHSA